MLTQKLKYTIACILSVLLLHVADLLYAQMPTKGIVYLHIAQSIYNWDPSQPVSLGINPVLNTIAMPFGSSGLAISPVLGSPNLMLTYYTNVNGYYYYYDGSQWVNTGHAVVTVNHGGSSNYVWSLNPDGYLVKYDGTGNGVLMSIVYPGAFDIFADTKDNFYILNSGYGLVKFNSAGLLQQVYLPAPGVSYSQLYVNSGIATVGDTIYWNNGSNSFVYKAVINSSNEIDIFGSVQLPISFIDMASCPRLADTAVRDSIYYCSNANSIVVQGFGQGPHSWSVLNGPAVINGSGSSVSVVTTANSVILDEHGLCEAGTDTFHIIVTSATVNAGPDDTLKNCDTIGLNGSVSSTTAGINYQYSWSPSSSIVSGLQTLSPIAKPLVNTDYVLTVTVDTSVGGCVWTDTVRIVVDSSLKADFSYSILYGCVEDTVAFINLSSNAVNYLWNFGDGLSGGLSSPNHIYPDQNLYNVSLIAWNGKCVDTVEKVVDIRHTLTADFDVSDDTICRGEIVVLTNTSVYSTINGPASFYWDFGNGSSDTNAHANVVFNVPGVYKVQMVVQDFIPCYDTTDRTIVVDPNPSVSMFLKDSLLCEGQGIIFSVSYEDIGSTGFEWDFGDFSSIIKNQSSLRYAYDTSGIFTVTLNAHYRACPDTSVSKVVTILPFPRLNLGPDTAMCPNSPDVVLGDYMNRNNPLARWLWNTGETTPSIAVDHPGTFWANVNIEGCSTNDTVEVLHDCYLAIPNAFTPNGDAINDYFFPRSLLSRGLVSFKMKIFNRWGQVIFETDKTDGRGWDGDYNGLAQPQGVYIYLIEAELKDGRKEKYQGNVTLMR